MKEILAILIFIALLVSQIKLSQDLSKQNILLQSKDERLVELFDSKIADYQFQLNTNYRGAIWEDSFFDSLNTCFEILRTYLPKTYIPDTSKLYLRRFMTERLSDRLGYSEVEILRMTNLGSIDSIFLGTNLNIVDKTLEVLNPYFLTKCFYFTDLDIWQLNKNWNLQAGDTTEFMIRILKNYDYLQNQLGFVETENLEVIKPYLGKLKVVIPENINERSTYDWNIKFYDWIKKDTIIQRIGIILN